jgi:membrane fusion protein (multidrug efflux system)
VEESGMNKKWLLGGVGMVLLAGGGVAVWTGALPMPGALAKSQAVAFGKQDGDKKPEVPLEFAPREVVQPSLARLPGSVEFSGPLVAPQTAVVRARAAGTLLTLGVAEGSRVQAGQVLGRIELADLSSRMAERKRRHRFGPRRAGAGRAQPRQQRAAGRAAVHLAAGTRAVARGAGYRACQPHAAQAALETTRVALRDGTLLAPISGIVAKRHVLPGEKLSMEQQVLTIVDLARLELAGSVGTHEVARIQPGMAVQVQVEGVDQPVPDVSRASRRRPNPARAASA